jgi:integrase
MASLFKDHRTAIYVVQFYVPTRKPVQRRVSTGVREQRPAERLRRFWEAEHAEGRWDPWTQPPPTPRKQQHPAVVASATLAGARAAFLDSRAHRAANTLANYERVTGWFVDHVGAGREVASVTAADVERWLEATDTNAVTKANYVRHLRAFFRYCRSEHLATQDITEHVRLERVPRRFPKALRPEEVERVAAYAEKHCRDGAERSSAWASSFIRLGAETAMRRNELLSLRWEHIDLDAGHVTAACTEAFMTKSGSERRIPLSGRARDLLSRLRRERPSVTGYVFESGGRPIDPHNCSDIVKRFAVRAGVPALTPHALRHSCITWLIERGVPVPVVQRFAGHADVSTTMRYCSLADDVYATQVRVALAA